MLYNYENSILQIAINSQMQSIEDTIQEVTQLKKDIARSSLAKSEKLYLYNMIDGTL